MSTTETPTPETPAAQTPPEGSDTGTGTEQTPTGFDAVIGGLDEEARKVILERISKPNNEARQLRERLKALEPKAAEFDKLDEARKSDLEKAQEAASKAAERTASLLKQVATSEIKALAVTAFADPEDAIAFLGDPTKFVGDDGSVDADAIKTDLADLLQRKPHLARQTEPGMPEPNPAQGGSGGGPSGASQLTRADVERLASEGKHAEIEQARKDGRLDRLLSGK